MPDVLSLWGLLLSAGPADGSSLRGLIGVVLGVGALIFVHELGHFLAAKWAGVKVEVFSLGFGRRILGFQRGETDYRLSLLPLGGYVRMLGQADDDPGQPATTDARDFRNKSAGKRFVILVAGVVMNIIFAATAFMLAFGLGVEFTAPEIGSIEPGSPAARADLKPGDQLVAVDGTEVLGFQDLQTLVALSSGEVELTVRRDGKTFTTRARPFRGEGDSYARIGVAPTYVVGEVAADSPLQGKALPATAAQSDRLLNVSPVDSRCPPDLRMTDADLDRAIEEAHGKVALTLERTRYDERGAPLSSELVPLEVDVPQKPDYTLGVTLPDTPYVRAVRADSPAARAGVLEGDRIVALGDVEPVLHSKLQETIKAVGATHEGPVRLVVERAGERKELQVQLELENQRQLAAALEGVTDEAARRDLTKAVGRWRLGIEYRADVVSTQTTLPQVDASAPPAVLEPGDRLVSISVNDSIPFLWRDPQPISGPDALQALLRARGDAPAKLTWVPKGSTDEKSAVVQGTKDAAHPYGDLGLRATLRQCAVQRGPVAACGLGLHQTVIQTQRILLTVRSFATGDVSTKELGGPIQIVSYTYAVATEDTFAKLLHLLAILSINLAVINILPIPVLDGGHIFFLAIEKLKGKPVSGDVMAYAQWAGLFLILGLMALVFFNDIRRILGVL